MATVQGSNITASSLTVSKTTTVNGTISWTKPTVPSGATINSCKLSGTANVTMSNRNVTVTVNGATVASSKSTGNYDFEIDLGTSNDTTSVTTTAKGSQNQASGTVSFSNLAYTVDYTEAAKVHTLTITSNEDWGVIRDYSTAEEHRGKTITLTAPTSDAEPFDLGIQPDSGYYIAQYTNLEGNTFTNVEIGYLSIEGPGSTPKTFTASITYAKKLTVTFKDWDGTTLKTQTVYSGSSATAPSNPSRTGYTFTGWDKTFTNVTSDLIVTAQYEKVEEPEGDLVTKTEALRPISVTQDSGYNNTWTDPANTYDTSTSTSGTIIVTGSSQSGFKRKYVDTIFNFDTSHIPANATINSATLTIRAKQSATTNLNMTASINGNDVIASTLLSSSAANYTADVKDYVKGLGQLNINLTSAATSNRTFTLYDVCIDVDYYYYEVPAPTYTVTFVDWDGFILKTETVKEGNSAIPPSDPVRDGYTFTGWSGDYTNITDNIIITAQYTQNSSGGEETTHLSKFHLGNVIVDKLYLGNGQIDKIYIGETLLYSISSENK